MLWDEATTEVWDGKVRWQPDTAPFPFLMHTFTSGSPPKDFLCKSAMILLMGFSFPHRPFIWKGEVYLGHWIGFLPAQERMSISRMDLENNTVHFLHRFSSLSPAVEEAPRSFVVEKARGLFPTSAAKQKEGFKREKNWGFVDEGGKLLIFYALLPCLVVVEFAPDTPDGVRMHSRYCYEPQAAAIEAATGGVVLLDI
jgi:hypothetical protein